MKRFKKGSMYKALLGALACLSISPAQGVLRGEGDRGTSQLPIQSIVLKPYRIAANVTLTEAEHAGRTGYFDVAAGAVVTLPRATGSGAVYSFFCKTTITSNSMKIQVANADDTMAGVQLTAQDAGDALVAFETASTSDTWTGNGTTTGGIKGDYVIIEDIAEGQYRVLGIGSATGTEATPFSAAVS